MVFLIVDNSSRTALLDCKQDYKRRPSSRDHPFGCDSLFRGSRWTVEFEILRLLRSPALRDCRMAVMERSYARWVG